MKVKRAELDQALRTVQPAIYDKKTVEELACVWFDGAGLWAYDGEIGIVVPFEAPGLECGVKADVLLPVVAAMGAAEIELTLKGDSLTVKAGKSRSTISVLPLARKPRVPPINSEQAIAITKDLLDALKLTSVAVSPNASRPDYLGTTILPRAKSLDLFSSDGSTATWMITDRPADWPDGRRAWPRRFCEQLVKLAGEEDRLFIHEGRALLIRKDRSRLFGNDLEIDQPVDFETMFRRMLPSDWEKLLVPIPDEMPEALKRASVVQPTDDSVRMEILGDQMQIDAQGAKGNMLEVLKLKDEADPMAFRITLPVLRRVLDHSTMMLTQPTVMIVENARTGFLHLISCSSAPKSDPNGAPWE